MKLVDYAGHECCVLGNGSVRLIAARSVGPRILSFGFVEKENLLAELPDFVADLPKGGVFHFYGGHRLWIAPESFETTYIPDDSPVEVSPMENGLRIVKPVEPQTGFQKSLEILLTGETQVTITHKIANHGHKPVSCSPWSITQFKTGGVAILPQARHDAGILPNRSVALWSYTDMSIPHVAWGREMILITANMTSPFKIGFPNPRGWLAYWLNGILFVKHATYDPQMEYYDLGSSSECYCNDQFLELETLAPVVAIAPGGTATHVETWNLYSDIECPQNEDEAIVLVKKLGLN
jgi:hypothetical protein